MRPESLLALPRPLQTVTVWFLGATLYAVTWHVLWHTSVPFWFLPAGLRFVALLTLPQRWLFPVLAGEWAANSYWSLTEAGMTPIQDLISIFTPSLCYLLATQALRSRPEFSDLIRVRDLTLLLAVGALAAIAASTIQGLSYPLVPILPNAGATTNVLTYAIGDIAGIILGISVVIVVRHGRRLWSDIPLIAAVVLVTIGVEMASRFAGEYAPHLRILIVVPILAAAMRQGVAGAALATVIANLVIAASAKLGLDQVMLFERQLMFLAVSVIGLLFGAAMGRQRALQAQLRAAAGRLVGLEERQRKRLAQDLHDDVGQILTALRTRIAVLQRTFGSARVEEGIADIARFADQAYQSAYAILHDLRPRTLDELGLEKTLRSGPPRQIVETAGKRYTATISGPVDQVAPETALTIYRIVQEAAANSVKHARATCVSVKLSVSPERTGYAIELEVSDDGQGFRSIASTEGLGLQGIEDRATAAGGQHRVESSDGGTTHRVHLFQP